LLRPAPWPDLVAKDGTVVFEARMQSSTSGATLGQLQDEIQPQLNQMISRLNSDFGKSRRRPRGTPFFHMWMAKVRCRQSSWR
jgi:hypothetical protein